MSVKLDRVTYSIGGKLLLDNVSVEIHPGQLTCVLGVNGAGKSTLLKAITGELKTDSGTISIDPSTSAESDAAAIAGQFATLPQGAGAPDYLTVREMIGLGRFVPGRKPWARLSELDHDVIQESIDAVGMRQLADRKLPTLSGGELQRSWIAFCIAQEKQYLLLDESLSAIDYTARWMYFDLLKSLCTAGKGVVLVTHDLFLVAEFADAVILMRDGRVMYSGPAEKGLELARQGTVRNPASTL
jgi:iron complex transport system ATP-binding protein